MPTFRDAIAMFDAASTAGRVPNRKTGGTGPLKTSRRDPILCNVRAAVRHALRATHGDRFVPDEVLDATELAPYLATLPLHAHLDATADERADPGKEQSNVALFVSVVTGQDAVHAPKVVEPARVLPAWRPLYNALDEYVRQNLKKRRSLRRAFIAFAEMAVANGVAAPEQVPDDYQTIMRWGRVIGITKKDVHGRLGGWRAALDEAGATTLAYAYDVVDRRAIGIRSMPDYPERLQAAGYAGLPQDASAQTMVSALAPKLGVALERVIGQGRAAGLTPSWADGLIDAASWLVAALIRLGEDTAKLTWLDVWLERRPVAVAGDAERADQLAAYGVDASADVALHSLARRAIDASARRSYELSPLWLFDARYEDDEVPVYTDSLRANLEAVFAVTDRYFGADLRAKKPKLWDDVKTEYGDLVTHVLEYNRPRALLGRKAKSSLLITWPQAVCVGLPYLARRCWALRRELAERERRIGHLRSRESQELLNRYCDALREYVVVAVLLDDSLRVKNYAGAVAGQHFRAEPERDAEGRWTGFRQVRTVFSGIDDHSVNLKVKTKVESEPNSRNRPLTPGIVDHTLLFEYWTVARPRALVAAGLLASVSAYDPETDTFAMFPTPRPSVARVSAYHASCASSEEAQMHTGGADAPMSAPADVWRGNITEDMLSDIFGRALHRICVEALGRELPSYDSPELTGMFRGLFAAHVVRLLVGTYLGGVRGLWSTAEYRTNDAESTLRRHYNHLAEWFRERDHARNPDGVRWFDAVMDRVLEARPEDAPRWSRFWERFDPSRPSVALGWLTTPTTHEAVSGRRSRRVTRWAA